jgi:hypothetical protein
LATAPCARSYTLPPLRGFIRMRLRCAISLILAIEQSLKKRMVFIADIDPVDAA